MDLAGLRISFSCLRHSGGSRGNRPAALVRAVGRHRRRVRHARRPESTWLPDKQKNRDRNVHRVGGATSLTCKTLYCVTSLLGTLRRLAPDDTGDTAGDHPRPPAGCFHKIASTRTSPRRPLPQRIVSNLTIDLGSDREPLGLGAESACGMRSRTSASSGVKGEGGANMV